MPLNNLQTTNGSCDRANLRVNLIPVGTCSITTVVQWNKMLTVATDRMFVAEVTEVLHNMGIKQLTRRQNLRHAASNVMAVDFCSPEIVWREYASLSLLMRPSIVRWSSCCLGCEEQSEFRCRPLPRAITVSTLPAPWLRERTLVTRA